MYRTAITSAAAALLLVVSARGSGADSDPPSVTETSRVSTTEGGESETSST